MHITTCPFCGAHNAQPVEDGWWCSDCQREYPTRAFKCPHPDCWEYAIVCNIHNCASLVSRPANPDPAGLTRSLAKAHRNKLLICLFASLVLSFFTGLISDWAGDMGGWEGKTVQLIFGLTGVVSSVMFLVFCVLLYSWFAGYKTAIRESSDFLDDRALYLRIHRDVFGPIPWG